MTGASGSVKRILWFLLVFAAGVVAITLLLVNGYPQYIIFATPLLIYPVYQLVDMHKKVLRKITYLFNAVASNDYNFGFGNSVVAGSSAANDPKVADSTVLNYSLNNIRDILAYNHKKEAEKERYYNLIEESVNTGIITLYPDGAIYKINREALKLLGVQYLAHINYLRGIDAELAGVLMNIQKGETRRINVKNESGELSLLINASDFKLEDVVLKVITINDINNALDEKELESWIKLTRILTHEIMNSLAPIVSLSNTLIETNNRHEITQGLGIINETGKGLVKFVEQYRKFTRLQTPVKEPFEIKPLLERNLALVCGGRKGFVQWSLIVEPEDTLVYADSDLVSLAVVNILKNAVAAVEAVECGNEFVEKLEESEAVLEGDKSVGKQEKMEVLVGDEAVGKRNKLIGKVDVRVYIDEKENVVIDISNNGGAIGQEIAEDIFLPFFTTKESGSGIGLSVAKQIMYLHGGQLRLASNTNEVVTFRLVFP